MKYTRVYKKYQSLFVTHKLCDTPETQEPIELELDSGTIPTWLNGIMYRIGPGRFNIAQKGGSTFSIKHAFDGLPFMHRFEIDGVSQSVKYNSRMLAGSVERRIKQKKYSGLVFFGHIPVMSFPQWIYHFFARVDRLILRPSDRENNAPDGQAVGVTATPNFPLPSNWEKDGKRVLVSKTDANVLQKIHADTLEPEKVFTYKSYDKQLNGQFSAAHHQYDPATKESFNFTVKFAPNPHINVFSVSESGKVTVLGDITHRKDGSQFQAPYIHSFWLSENYVIIPESPLTYQDKGLSFLLNGSVLSSMTWVENVPTYLHVFSRKGDGLVASIPVPAFFTFHVANAFDKVDPVNGDIILTLDSASFEDGDIMQQVYNFGTPHYKGYKPLYKTKAGKLNGMAFPPSHQQTFGDLKRYVLNVSRSELVSHEILCKNLEFPRFNQKLIGKPAEYVFGCELNGSTEKTHATGYLVKVNTQTKKVARYGQEGVNCSEPIFVPTPNAEKEDDGVLLTLANHFDRCYLIVVDACSMTELACFNIGKFTAVTFHGSYVDHEFKSININ